MEGKVSLAWAIQTDHAQLGARLEAWIETKAAITTLKACFRHYRLPPKAASPKRGIPPEIVTLIANEMKATVYERRVQRWTKVQRCMELECDTLDHFTSRDLEHCGWWIPKAPRHLIRNTFAREASERHEMRIGRHLEKIMPCADETEKGRFARHIDVSRSRHLDIQDCNHRRRSWCETLSDGFTALAFCI